MNLSHTIRLDLTYKQRLYFSRAAGATRFVWNWALAEWDRQYKSGEKPNGMRLKKEFNAVKYSLFPWLKGVHRDSHAAPFLDLQKAFCRYFKGIANRPKFKVRGKCRESFYVANDQFSISGNRIRFPIIGWVRMRESLRFDGKICCARILKKYGHWYVSISVEVVDSQSVHPKDSVVGVDLGVKSLAVLSSGEAFQNPKSLAKLAVPLARSHRRLSRKKNGSNRRQKAKQKLARIYGRIANIRKDFLHKMTTRICREHSVIAIEDLNVKGMMKNRRLAGAISDASLSEIRRQLTYKATIFALSL